MRIQLNTRAATYADIEALPDNIVGEIIHGRLPDAAYFELAPDWVCEVLSPATAQIGRTDKLVIYAAYGVDHVWLVDPDLRTLETLTLTDGKWLLSGTFKNDERVSAAPFEAHTFGLETLWVDARHCERKIP